MIPFSPYAENRSVPMPAERFFIKQARRNPGGPVLWFVIESLSGLQYPLPFSLKYIYFYISAYKKKSFIKNFRQAKILFDICFSCGMMITESVCTTDACRSERIINKWEVPCVYEL